MRRRRQNKFKPVDIDPKDPANILIYENEDKHAKSPPMMEELKFTHPFGALLIGQTGSGKSLLALNLLNNKAMFGGYFDVTYLFGRTIRSDDTFDRLKIPESNKFSGTDKQMIKELTKIIEKHKKEVQNKGKLKAPKVMIIVEDSTALKDFQRSSPFLEAFTASRHFNGSLIVCAHKYTGVDRTARLQAHYIAIFKANNTEQEKVAEEYAPTNKKEFMKIIKNAFVPDERNKKPFFFINGKSAQYPFRKTLDQGYEYR